MCVCKKKFTESFLKNFFKFIASFFFSSEQQKFNFISVFYSFEKKTKKNYWIFIEKNKSHYTFFFWKKYPSFVDFEKISRNFYFFFYQIFFQNKFDLKNQIQFGFSCVFGNSFNSTTSWRGEKSFLSNFEILKFPLFPVCLFDLAFNTPPAPNNHHHDWHWPFLEIWVFGWSVYLPIKMAKK